MLRRGRRPRRPAVFPLLRRGGACPSRLSDLSVHWREGHTLKGTWPLPCAKPGRRMARRPGVLSILCFYHWVFLFRFAAQLSYTRRMMTTIRMQKKIWAL